MYTHNWSTLVTGRGTKIAFVIRRVLKWIVSVVQDLLTIDSMLGGCLADLVICILFCLFGSSSDS